jgi:hypothetical protein
MNISHSPAIVLYYHFFNDSFFADPEGDDYSPENPDFVGYVTSLPDEPDNAICVQDTVGRLDGRIHKTGETIVHPGIQVRVRSESFVLGWAKANEIKTALEQIKNDSVSVVDPISGTTHTYTIHSATLTSPILPIGEGKEGRRENFTINVVLTITENE